MGASVRDVAVTDAEARSLAAEAYLFGYPLVLMDVTREVLTAAAAPRADGTAAPLNELAQMPAYVSPDFRDVVRISLNSLWSTAWLDLRDEPIVLSVPDTHGRYYVFSMLDMWTDVFGSVGKRTTGTGPGAFLIAGPRWRGAPPSGIRRVFQSSTRHAWILGQTQADGPADFAAVNAIQAGYRLTPLGAWLGSPAATTRAPVNKPVGAHAPPPDQVAAMDAAAFLARLASVIEGEPPRAADLAVVSRLRRIGVEPGRPFDLAPLGASTARALEGGIAMARAELDGAVAGWDAAHPWIQPPDVGRYGTDYRTRAHIAHIGLGANLPEDTVYPTTWRDAEGRLLDGAHRYLLRFEAGQLPPTRATWSVSIYRGHHYVRNAVDRYAIAPWMPLRFEPDGSLEIHIQAESPGQERASNWLPTPGSTGAFNLTIRNYWPRREALDGTWSPPPIRRVD